MRVFALDDGDSLVAALENRLSRLLCLGDLALEQIGRCEGIVSTNAPILRVFGVANRWVLNVELKKTSVANWWRGEAELYVQT